MLHIVTYRCKTHASIEFGFAKREGRMLISGKYFGNQMDFFSEKSKTLEKKKSVGKYQDVVFHQVNELVVRCPRVYRSQAAYSSYIES